VGYPLGFADLKESGEELLVCEARVAEDCAAGLDCFDDFVGLVAGEGEAGRSCVNFHGAT
jgi:hypothetical protein